MPCFVANLASSSKYLTLCKSTAAELSNHMASYCVWTYMMSFSLYRSGDFKIEGLELLLRNGVEVNEVSDIGNTLLHLVRRVEEAQLLLRYPGHLINHQNRRGYTPLIVFSRLRDSTLIEEAIRHGADVLAYDNNGMTSLHHSFAQISRTYFGSLGRAQEEYKSLIKVAAVMLSSGAEVLQGDNCQCPCSTSGCSPTRSLFRSSRSGIGQVANLSMIPWLLEWYMLLRVFYPTKVDQVLDGIFSLRRFDCSSSCQRAPGNFPPSSPCHK